MDINNEDIFIDSMVTSAQRFKGFGIYKASNSLIQKNRFDESFMYFFINNSTDSLIIDKREGFQRCG